MSLQFLNLKKIATRYGEPYISTTYGIFSSDTKNLGRKGAWIGVDKDGSLRICPKMLNCGNDWLDKFASDFVNGRVEMQEVL